MPSSEKPEKPPTPLDSQHREPLWPWFFPTLCLGLVIRLWLAVTSDIPLHYDEVMQYLEQGHRLVFDYGTIPWEYQRGARSLLTPGTIASILYGFKIFGFDSPEFYVPGVKAFFCLVSMLIPAGMYFYSRQHFSEKSARIALILGCFWYELIVFAHKPLTTHTAVALVMLALMLSVRKNNSLAALLQAVAFTIAMALRIHLTPLILFMMAVSWIKLPKRQRVFFLAGAGVAFFAVGLLDYLSWGGWWSSYSQEVRIQLFERVAASFGETPFYQFALWLFISTVGVFFLVLFWAGFHFRQHRFLLISLLIVCGVHSLIGAKEYRYIFVAIPLWLLLASVMISQLRQWQSALLIAGIGVISFCGFFNKLPSQGEVYKGIGYTIHDFRERRNDLQAYLYLNKIDDVTGVIDVTNHWSISGGYYYLHKKVPLYDSALYQKHLTHQRLPAYASHLITFTNVQTIPGYSRMKTFSSSSRDDLVVWQRTPLRQAQRTWKCYLIKRL